MSLSHRPVGPLEVLVALAMATAAAAGSQVPPPDSPGWVRGPALGIMYNWSSPNGIDEERSRFDAKEWIDCARQAGAEFVYLMAKMDDGLAYYDTTFSKSKTKQDFLSQLILEARKAGLKIGLYYAVSLDGYQGDLHPDWRLLTKQGETADADGSSLLNIHSPYRDFVMRQVKELSERYPFDGLWLDWPWYFVNNDEFSQLAFRKQFHKPMFAATARELEGFHVSSMTVFLEESLALIRNKLSSAVLTVNADVLPMHPILPPDQSQVLYVTSEYLRAAEPSIGYHTVEAHTSRRASTLSKYLRANTTKPFEIGTTTGYYGDWGRTFTLKARQLLELETAAVTAQGGNIYVGIQPFPDGGLHPEESGLVSAMGEWIAKRKPYLNETKPLAEVAILVDSPVGTPLWPAWTAGLLNRRDPWGDRLRRPRPWPYHATNDAVGGRVEYLANGFEQALLQYHIPFRLVTPEADFSGCRLLILPDAVPLSDTVIQRIREYVREGGSVLAEGHASLARSDGTRRDDFGLSAVLGVQFQGYSPHADANYAFVTGKNLKAELTAYPLLFQGGAIQVRLAGGRSEAELIYPLVNLATRPVFRWSVHNPPGAPSGYPIVVSHQFGEGRVIYFSGQLSDHIGDNGHQDPWSKRLFLNMVNDLVPNPMIRASLPTNVEMVLNGQGQRIVLHLLNHGPVIGDQTVAGSPGNGDVTLNLHSIGPIRQVHTVPDGRPIRTKTNGSQLTVSIEALNPVDTIVVFEK